METGLELRKTHRDPPLGMRYAGFRQALTESHTNLKYERQQAREAIFDRLQRLPPVPLCKIIGIADLRSIWNHLDLGHCPAISLWCGIWWQYVSAKITFTPNDANDIAFLPAYGYADYAITERQMGHFVRQSDDAYHDRVFASPIELVNALGPTLEPPVHDNVRG